MDNGSFFNDRVNFVDHSLSRALSNFDVTHNFVGSYSYAIPFAKAFSNLPKRLVNGWEIAGITRLSTGFPVGLLGSFDRSLHGTSGLDMPNFTGQIDYAGDPRNAGHLWMTRTGFSLPALGSFGTAPRRFFHGPGFNNWNLALHKDTRIRENIAIPFAPLSGPRRSQAYRDYDVTEYPCTILGVRQHRTKPRNLDGGDC